LGTITLILTLILTLLLLPEHAAGPMLVLTQWEVARWTYGQDWILARWPRNASHEGASTISSARWSRT